MEKYKWKVVFDNGMIIYVFAEDLNGVCEEIKNGPQAIIVIKLD